jgi:CBS domain-containing protein
MPEELDDELQEMFVDPKRREKTLSNEVLRLPIKVLRLQEAITVSPTTTIQKAIEEMQKHREGCVLIMESGRLTGIFTERDLLYKVVGKIHDLSSEAVSDYSTHNPESMKLTDSIGHALNLMHVGGYRHIPIVDDKHKPTGVISIKDAVAFLSEFFPEDVLNIRSKALRATTEREGA